MSRPGHPREAGFTVYELIVAIVLIGIALQPLVGILADNTRMATDRRERQDAERLLRNEAALVAAADPARVAATRTYRADAGGAADPAGPYLVTTRKAVRCGVGEALRDNAGEGLPEGCAEGGVVADYTVSVAFQRAAGEDGTTTLSHSFSAPAGDPRGAAVGGTP